MNRYLTSFKRRLTIVTAAAILAILTFAATSSALTVAGSTKRTPQRQASPAAVAVAKAKIEAASKAKTSAETKAKTEAEKKAERHAGARQQTAEFRVKILRTRTLTKTSTEPVSSSSTATTTVITTTATVTAAATPTTTSASQTPTIATATATASASVTPPVATTPIATPALNTTITPTITTPAVTTPAVTTPTVTTPAVTTPAVTTPAVTTPTVTTPAPATSGPTGVSGNWNLSFDDEFNGTSLNTSAWSTHDGWTNQNGVTDEASNISVSGGYANLTLSSATSGATITTNTATLGVGDYAEARVSMPGSGSTMNDWDAFWASGPAWPAAGENDVTESLGGESTVNYHSPSGAHNEGVVPGAWAGAFHTYGIYRGSNYANVYWDGVLVKHYSTDDNSQPQTLIFTVGNGQGDPVATGTAGTMQIDYLRVWTPAS